ncbi:response regulator transcription factor [Dysgonomonas macrotermitis]|uniref:DNA-binding response regulator, OmpR family, contains REC and winged-helix (WHTH) domain n=1 Tax=Dysgonomonas macrotermitis TaxID=1346286 RepID=A0A1M5GN74_9BACT|nr:response regulator transcription factor [Dysgonomonas macrotermitis]SHG05185.1 DNA-binding response regulator, OmpR family, contains REC and winged-helix (wHTH) domain [Dysgonomonas macrotermitis]
MKILVIEDEFEMLKSIETFMESENFLVERATDFDSGMEKIAMYEYDCILLDINLPGGNGLKILEEMKKKGIRGNVIIISARDSVDDKISGLDSGADDYLAKPFHLAELSSRIKAVIRRKQQGGKNNLTLGNLFIDFSARIVEIDGTELKLNRKEFDILSFFVVNTNRLITKETLAEHVWGDNIDMADNFDFVYSQVKNLRKKLKENDANITISNVYGVGYKVTV